MKKVFNFKIIVECNIVLFIIIAICACNSTHKTSGATHDNLLDFSDSFYVYNVSYVEGLLYVYEDQEPIGSEFYNNVEGVYVFLFLKDTLKTKISDSLKLDEAIRSDGILIIYNSFDIKDFIVNHTGDTIALKNFSTATSILGGDMEARHNDYPLKIIEYKGKVAFGFYSTKYEMGYPGTGGYCGFPRGYLKHAILFDCSWCN